MFGFLFVSGDDLELLIAEDFIQLKKPDRLMRIRITNHVQFKKTHIKLFAQ